MSMAFDPATIGKFLDGMVHISAAGDRLSVLRHRSFLLVHLGFALLALCAFPIWLAVVGTTSMTQALTFAWLVAPLAIALYLSRTGNLGIAHLLSAAVFTGLIVWIAGQGGGLDSQALLFIALVPAGSALSGSLRVAIAAVAIAALGIMLLALGGTVDALPAWTALAAVLFAGGLAINLESLAREGAGVAEEGEARFRLIADNATEMITRHALNGDVDFASPAARGLTGASTADLLGDGLFRRIHVGDRPAYLTALSEAFIGKRPTAAALRLLREIESGEPQFISVEMRCRPVADEKGRVGAVVAVTRDVSAAKEHEDELREARELAERASHAKTQFLAHMSHELRTPLNAIIGFSEILESDTIASLQLERRCEYARLIRASGEHLLQVVNGILDMSKIESGMFDIQPEKMAVGPVIASCCEMMSGQAAKRAVVLVSTAPDTLPEITVDPRACRQILLNLLSNAIKFTDRGGTVQVGARIDGKFMAIFVRDTGIGIAAEDIPRLGTPFVQAETVYTRQYEGTGLGLSMVKGLAGLHGGRMSIESKPGKGTLATVWLPIDAVKPVRPAKIAERVLGGVDEKERKSA
jgi:cell cycle sensor histidine kinase DivJ